MLKWFWKWRAEQERQKKIEQKLDAALIDHGFFTRVAQARILRAEQRLIEQATPALRRVRKLHHQFLIGGSSGQ